MDAKEFIRQRNRMCKKYNSAGNVGCKNCPAWEYSCVGVDEMEEEDFKLIDVIEKWAKENPPKKMRTEFLKLFSNAQLEHCPPHFCIRVLIGEYKDSECLNCCEKHWEEFWDREI